MAGSINACLSSMHTHWITPVYFAACLLRDYACRRTWIDWSWLERHSSPTLDDGSIVCARPLRSIHVMSTASACNGSSASVSSSSANSMSIRSTCTIAECARYGWCSLARGHAVSAQAVNSDADVVAVGHAAQYVASLEGSRWKHHGAGSCPVRASSNVYHGGARAQAWMRYRCASAISPSQLITPSSVPSGVADGRC